MECIDFEHREPESRAIRQHHDAGLYRAQALVSAARARDLSQHRFCAAAEDYIRLK